MYMAIFNSMHLNKRPVLSITQLGCPQSAVHNNYNRLAAQKGIFLSIFSTISIEKSVLLGHFVLWLVFFTQDSIEVDARAEESTRETEE
jgi:hypothetical protein